MFRNPYFPQGQDGLFGSQQMINQPAGNPNYIGPISPEWGQQPQQMMASPMAQPVSPITTPPPPQTQGLDYSTPSDLFPEMNVSDAPEYGSFQDFSQGVGKGSAGGPAGTAGFNNYDMAST